MIGSQRAMRAAATALVAAISVAGCAGGQGDSAPAPPAAAAPTATTAASTQPLQQDAEAAVRATFEAYRQALLARDAQAATALVSDDTIEHYRSLASVAGTGGPQEIGARSLVDRMTVALLRTERTPADLAAMDGRELFAYTVDAGLIDPSSVAAAELGSVRIVGQRAIVQAVFRGTPSPINYEFVRDDGRWLFDLVPTVEAGNIALLQVVQQSVVSEDQFIFESVERATGQRIDRAIFARP